MTEDTLTRRPGTSDFAEFYAGYVARVGDGNILEILSGQIAETLALLARVPAGSGLYRPAPAEWSVCQVVGHMIDTERIFAARALWFARGDRSPQPGFDQDDFVKGADFDAVPLSELCEEFRLVRSTTICLFKNMPAVSWDRRGVASGSTTSVRGWAFCIAGHELHHRQSLQTDYSLV